MKEKEDIFTFITAAGESKAAASTYDTDAKHRLIENNTQCGPLHYKTEQHHLMSDSQSHGEKQTEHRREGQGGDRESV